MSEANSKLYLHETVTKQLDKIVALTLFIMEIHLFTTTLEREASCRKKLSAAFPDRNYYRPHLPSYFRPTVRCHLQLE